MNAFNADGRWIKCPYPECPNWVDTSTEVPAKLLTISVPSIPFPREISWFACEQHKDQVKAAKFDVQLEFQKHAPSFTRSSTNELKLLLGYIYRKPLEPLQRDIEEGIARWTKNLTEKQDDGNGAKLEVALLNALARLGIPSFFAGSAAYGGNETPVFDLIALGFFQYHPPTALLISGRATLIGEKAQAIFRGRPRGRLGTDGSGKGCLRGRLPLFFILEWHYREPVPRVGFLLPG